LLVAKSCVWPCRSMKINNSKVVKILLTVFMGLKIPAEIGDGKSA
jgi:hypothetical protein